MSKLFNLIVSIIICQLAGIIGAVFTAPSIPGWYAGLQKPSFNPPSWLFGPVWTTLYFLMGIALFLIWQEGIDKKEVKIALGIFLVQLVLNSLWSILFFGLKQPFWAFIEIIALWGLILLTILKFYPIKPLAAWLLVPYLAWVSFASVLNFFIFRLN